MSRKFIDIGVFLVILHHKTYRRVMIIGIGETILDIIFKHDQPQAAVPGGSTFNAIVSLGRCGVPCTIVTEVGDDHVGDIVVDYLRANNVDTQFVNRHVNGRSHISLAFLDDNSDAHYQFYKDHAHVQLQDCLPDVKRGDLVVFGSFFAINPVIRDAVYAFLQSARKAGAVLFYDINFRASHIPDIPETLGNVQENMRLSTVVRGSLDDFKYLFGTQNVTEIYEKHIRDYCPCFICTCGGAPIQLRTPSVSTAFSTEQLSPVSTIGAGDNFNAGFLYALFKNGTIRHEQFPTMDCDEWEPLIRCGQAFSADVCMSYNNSVSPEFAHKL